MEVSETKVSEVRTYVRAEREMVVVVLKLLGGREGVPDLDVVGEERVPIVIDPIEHLKKMEKKLKQIF